MCYVHKVIKGLLHNTPWSNGFQVKGYGFSEDALQHMRSYWTNREQRVQVNSKFSLVENIIPRVRQDSVLGSLLFVTNDLFLFVLNSYLSNYANGNTLYAFGYNPEEI